MRLVRSISSSIAVLSFLLVFTTGAQAGITPYANVGTQNSATYAFTVENTGDVIAYFAGSSAAYNEEIGLIVNGVNVGIYGLQNHSSTVGESIDFGSFAAGSVVEFVDVVSTSSDTWYSNPAMNYDGVNHIYATSYDGTGLGGGIPSGLFVGFEDLPAWWSDFDYNDTSFVVTNVGDPPTPEPAMLPVLIAGLVGLAVVALRRRRRSAELN